MSSDITWASYTLQSKKLAEPSERAFVADDGDDDFFRLLALSLQRRQILWMEKRFRPFGRLVANFKVSESRNHLRPDQLRQIGLTKEFEMDGIQLLMYLTEKILWCQTHSHFDRTGSGSSAHYTVSFCMGWIEQGGSAGLRIGKEADFHTKCQQTCHDRMLFASFIF